MTTITITIAISRKTTITKYNSSTATKDHRREPATTMTIAAGNSNGVVCARTDTQGDPDTNG